MRSGPKVSGRSRRVAADQGWSLRGVPLYSLVHLETLYKVKVVLTIKHTNLRPRSHSIVTLTLIQCSCLHRPLRTCSRVYKSSVMMETAGDFIKKFLELATIMC